jgi:hypothetical protein
MDDYKRLNSNCLRVMEVWLAHGNHLAVQPIHNFKCILSNDLGKLLIDKGGKVMITVDSQHFATFRGVAVARSAYSGETAFHNFPLVLTRA